MAFFKAKIWSGAGWLLTLCVILVVVAGIYIWAHACNKGHDHKTLDTTQLAGIDNAISKFPDSAKDSAAERKSRDAQIIAFLNNEYNGRLNKDWIVRTNLVLAQLDNAGAKQYITTKEIIVDDFFWFTGSGSYVEVLFWALFGVLVSLIYYVSLANSQAIKPVTDPDIGPFDYSQVPAQVAKIFYAPACALVLVLGYNMLNSDNKMTDISIGKGLLLFSFICGFFSGRVMKFLDRLKDLVLPESSSTSSGGSSAAAAADITVGLQLSPAAVQLPEAADITEGGFNKATVTLTPDAGGDAITLTAPTDDQGAQFTGKQVPLGKYTLKAALAHTDSAGATTNLAASQDIEITAAATSFTLSLDKTADNG